MKQLFLFLFFLISIHTQAQDYQQIKSLMSLDTVRVESLSFPAEFQKAAIYSDKIACTVLDLEQDIQVHVDYKFDGKSWKIHKISPKGTFYAGEGLVGRIVPGGKANIPNIPNMSNERDFLITPDSTQWFTSDVSGQFQIYTHSNKVVNKIEFPDLNDKHIINLWANSETIFFDVFSADLIHEGCYSFQDNNLKNSGLDVNSLSFNDSIIAYIKDSKLVVHQHVNVNETMSFIFAFTDQTYENALSLSTLEAEKLQIDTTYIRDGVFQEEAKQKMREILHSSPDFEEKRRNFILEKIQAPEKLVSFSFFFLDNDYESGITLSKQEVQTLEITSSSVNDGVLLPDAQAKMEEILQTDTTDFSFRRKNELLEKISTPELVSFSFFFLDNDYENGITLSKQEVQTLEITSSSVNDGVLLPDAQAKMEEILQTDTTDFSLNRKDELLEKIATPELVSFSFFFLDNDYESGISLSEHEVQTLEITSASVSDGVLLPDAQAKIEQILQSDTTDFSLNRKNEILEKISTPELVTFSFFFLDNDYEKAITLSKKQIDFLEIKSNDVIDGILTNEAKEQIIDKLNTDTLAFSDNAKNELLDKLKVPKENESFNFLFLDQTYSTAINLSASEFTTMGLTSESLVDGVLTNKAKQKMISFLKKTEAFDENRKNELLSYLVEKEEEPDVIEFFGFFADSDTYITTVEAVQDVESNGIITVSGLENYIEDIQPNEMKTKLLNILTIRAWNEDSELQIKDTVVIQVGAYHRKFDDFAKHVKKVSKISEKDYLFLQSLSIYCVSKENVYYYRTKTNIDQMLRIKKALYFDHPFIVPKNNNHD